MADDTSIEPSDIPKLLEIVRKLQAEDTSLNIYELYKHPEARAKLFSQIPEALLYGFEYDTDTSPKSGILRLSRTAIRKHLKENDCQHRQTGTRGVTRFVRATSRDRKPVYPRYGSQWDTSRRLNRNEALGLSERF